MFNVYVLKSLRNGKRYIGFTANSLSKRLRWHRLGLTAWTKQNGPFELIHAEEFNNKEQALKRERFFKTGNGRKTLNLILSKKSSSASAKKHGGPATQFGGG